LVVFIQLALGFAYIILAYFTNDFNIYGQAVVVGFVFIEAVLNIILMYLFAKSLLRVMVACNKHAAVYPVPVMTVSKSISISESFTESESFDANGRESQLNNDVVPNPNQIKIEKKN